MKNRYRQRMVFEFDVWADSEDDATEIVAEYYHEIAHEWNPETLLLDEEDQTFDPINEDEDEVTA